MMRSEASSVGLFGKVPWHDEFLRLRMEGPAFDAFDEWLTSAVEWASTRAGEGWSEAYDRGGVHAFVFRAPGDASSLLAGAVAPSRDGAGRRYPLVVGCPIRYASELSAAPEAIPIMLDELWEATGDLLVQARTHDRIDLEERVRRLEPPILSTPSDIIASYEQWVRDLPLGELWSLLFGEAGAAAAVIALRVIVEAIAPYRKVERAKTPLTLRVPLGAAGGAAVCFWIDFVRRVALWSSTIPSFFWSHDGEAGSLLLHLGDPPRCTMAELWMPGRSRDEICNLMQPSELEQLGTIDPPQALARLVFDTDRSVLHLMKAAELGF
jgi:type VI secretion system ImpM family protein